MKQHWTNHRLVPFLAAFLISALIVVPLTGLPPSVGGIPVWYQNTFFRGLLAMGIAGGISILLLWLKILQPVRWNVIDGAVLVLLACMVVRISLPIWMPSALDFIPQSAWIQITFLAGIYGISRMLWPSMNKKPFQL